MLLEKSNQLVYMLKENLFKKTTLLINKIYKLQILKIFNMKKIKKIIEPYIFQQIL